MKPRFAMGAALALLACATGYVRADNLVINGDFETGSFSGWSAQGNYLLVADNAKPGQTLGGSGPHAGSNYAALGSTGAGGSLSQQLATTAGQLYDISFYVASDGSAGNSFGVSFGGQVLAPTAHLGQQGYALYNFQATASGTQSALTFFEQAPAGYLSLDDVSVSTIPNSQPTADSPEPASLTLLLVGGLGVGGYCARRRRTRTAV